MKGRTRVSDRLVTHFPVRWCLSDFIETLCLHTEAAQSIHHRSCAPKDLTSITIRRRTR